MISVSPSCFAVLAFVFFVGAGGSSLTPGGKNVLTKYQTYYVTVQTTTKTLSYRKTCWRTCTLWVFCKTKCRDVSFYKWVPSSKRVTKRRAVYECRLGWKANGNECTTPICSTGCHNHGSCTAPNICNCTAGWTGLQCGTDINECNGTRHGCQETCVNFPGGYNCSCPRGHFLASNGKNCTDHDECAGNIHGCQQGCDNYPGGYNCTCTSGYRLNISDFKSCDDVNECRENISGCAHNCINGIGNYSCSCHPGYYLKTDGKSCNDIDECSSGLDDCEHNCLNTQGNYSCKCRPGFDLSNDGKHCIGRPCESIHTPINGKMNCTGNTTEHVCQFKCSPGYDLIGSTNRTCSAQKAWTGVNTTCKIIHCPIPVAPLKGFVYTPCNTEFTSECIVGCARGHFIDGTSSITCNADGFWEPRITCTEIKACQPSPCQNGGKCSSISSSRYSCNCSQTGYKGSKCDVGTIATSHYPTLTPGVPSSPLEFISSSPSDYIILTPTTRRDVIFNPPFLNFSKTSPRQSMTVTSQRRGLYFIQYLLSGPNAADFEPPQKDIVFVEQIIKSTNQTSGNSSQNLTLPIGCHQLEINKCSRNADAIVSSSTASWDTLGPMTSTSGIVMVEIGNTMLPLALLGTSVSTKVKPSIEEHCNKFNANYSIEKLMKSNVLTKSFLNVIQSSFPSWLLVSSPQDKNTKTYLSSDLKTYFLSSNKLRQTDVGKGQPFADKTYFSLLLSQDIKLTVEGDENVFGLRGKKSPFSIAVDLCSSHPKNVIIRPSTNDAAVLSNVSVLKRLMENGWELTIRSLQISKTKSIAKLQKGLYWNGKRFVRIDSTTNGDLALVSSLRKYFTNEYMVNCYLEFDGTMVIGVNDIDNILHSPLNNKWSVDLYGNTKLTIELRVEGKKTKVTLNAPKSISYATFGGSLREQRDPEGLYMSHALEESPFLHSDLNKFVELGSNRTLSVLINTKLQTNKINNRSDTIRAISMVFEGHLKFGLLRFNDVDIKLWTQYTEQSNTSSLLLKDFGIELNGDNRNTASREFGIFKTSPSKPRLYITSRQNGSSVGSFQSSVKFLGLQSRVNVSFSRDGLTFNTSGKIHGLYSARIRCDSPLASWENQKFVANGEFKTESGGLVRDLNRALYEYGSGVLNGAKRRISSFTQREEKANTRVEDMIAFTETKREEMSKSLEEYQIAEENLSAAEIDFKNLQDNVSGRLKGLRLRLNNLCELNNCSLDVCREGIVCRNCDYKVAGKSKRTCLRDCYKIEQRRIELKPSSVQCKEQSCTRVYLKNALSMNGLKEALGTITKEIFSFGKVPSDSSFMKFSSARIDASSIFFPGSSKDGVCSRLNSDIPKTTEGHSRMSCGKDRRDGFWDCRVRLQTCIKTRSEYEYFHKQYMCERPCELHVTNETIAKSCCSADPCASRIVNITCVAENAFCNKIRDDALDKTRLNSSVNTLKRLEKARENASYWRIVKQKAAIRLLSASNSLNMSQKALKSLKNAYNVTIESGRRISKILVQPLKLDGQLNERLKSFLLVKFDSIKFKVNIENADQNLLLPVRIMFKLNGSQEELVSVLDFKRFNTSLRSIAEAILGRYMRELPEPAKLRRKRSAQNNGNSFSGSTNSSSNETTHHTISSLQKYHKLCSEFTNFERALYDTSMSLYNLTSEANQLVHNAEATNAPEPFNASKILKDLRINDTIALAFGLGTDKTIYLSNLEKDPVLSQALDLQIEAIKDGFQPLYLTSKLLYKNWYSAMDNIFNVVLQNCSGFEDCLTYIIDGLSEINDAADLPGADNVRRLIADLETKLFNLIQNVDMSIGDAAEGSADILKILKDMTRLQLFCARAPNITKHPEPFTEMGVARTLVLTCNATGDSLVYNWRLNGDLLEDQTTNMLLIRNTTPSHTGNYTCVVSNHISLETSTPALVVIHPPPSITVQPVNLLSVVLSVNDSLRCAAKSTDNHLSYQWSFKSTNSTIFSALTNEVFPYLNFAPMTAHHEGWYFCNVSNSYGFSISTKSFVKALKFALPVPAATLSLSVSRKPNTNATFLPRSKSSFSYEQIKSQISELLRFPGGNVSNASKPQIKGLHLTKCEVIRSHKTPANSIAEVCQWTVSYVGRNVTTSSSMNEIFQANVQKVINSAREVKSAVSELVKATNKGALSFAVGNQKFIVEQNSVGVEDFSLICSTGHNLIEDDFRCVDCSPGFYGEINENLIASCQRCPLGSYQANSGQISCIECPEGFTTMNEASYDKSQCKVICPAGQYGKITQNIGQCLECPVNTYQPKRGEFNCSTCPIGQVTTTKGATDISKCILEPTERHTTRIQTTPGEGTRGGEPSGGGPSAGKLGSSDVGTNYAAVIGGAVGGCLFLGLLAFLFVKKRRSRSKDDDNPTNSDGKDLVITHPAIELTDWRENPAYVVDEGDFMDKGYSTENPTYQSSFVSDSQQGEEVGQENPIYLHDPVDDPSLPDGVVRRDDSNDTSDSDLKVYKSYENSDGATDFGNPLYGAFPSKDERGKVKLTLTDDAPVDEDV